MIRYLFPPVRHTASHSASEPLPEWKRLHGVADAEMPRVRASFSGAVKVLQGMLPNGVDQESDLHDVLASYEAELLRVFKLAYLRLFGKSAEVAAEHLPGRVEGFSVVNNEPEPSPKPFVFPSKAARIRALYATGLTVAQIARETSYPYGQVYNTTKQMAEGKLGMLTAFVLPDYVVRELIAARAAVHLSNESKFLAPEDLHCTLTYTPPERIDVPSDKVDVARSVLAEIAAEQAPINVDLMPGYFEATPNSDGKDVVVVLLESPVLMEFQAKLAAALRKAGVFVSSDFAYKPHITLAYVPVGTGKPDLDLSGIGEAPLLDTVEVKYGDDEPIKLKLGTKVFAEPLPDPALNPFQVEEFVFGLRFDLTNPRAVDWIDRHAGDLVAQIMDEQRLSIRKVLNDGFTQGLTRVEVGRRIRDTIGLTRAQAQYVESYYLRVVSSGVPVEKARLLADRYHQNWISYRSRVIARTECLPGDTVIDAAEIEAVYRRWYDGPMINILASDGHKLSCTPNHPVLTKRGWLAAGEITESDYLVCDAGEKVGGSLQGLGVLLDPDVQARPSTLSEIFDTLSVGRNIERNRGQKRDFHGDGREGYVDTLSVDGVLSLGSFSPLYKPVVDEVFSPSDLSITPYCSACGRLLSIDKQVCRCLVPNRNAEASQPLSYGDAHDSKRSSNGIRRLSSQVSFDDCVGENVARSSWTDPDAHLSESFGESMRIHSEVRSHVLKIESTLVHARGLGVLLGASALHQFYSLPLSSDRNTGILDLSKNRGGACFKSESDRTGGVPGQVHVDDPVHGQVGSGSVLLTRVIGVRTDDYSGYVYNLSTPYGYFNAAGGVYTGNTIAASVAGQQELWQQSVEQGYLDAGEVEQMWIVTPDDRLCRRCRPYQGLRAPLGGTFVGYISGPPLHPSCRCAISVVEVGISRKPGPTPPPYEQKDNIYKLQPKVASELLEEALGQARLDASVRLVVP